jgi:tRNA (guanine10-N2)-dimethyltransferase
MDPLLVQFTGDHLELARAELDALLEVVQGEGAEEIAPGLVRVKVPRGTAEEVARRAGLARTMAVELARADTAEGLDTSGIAVKGTFAVRATVLDGAPEGARAPDIERAVGAKIKGGRVDLLDPQHVFRVFVGKDARLGHEIYDRASDDFEERAVKHRPFFQPVSLHPKFARALVNLTAVHDGQHLLDPFCGTAGVLIEAGLCGAHPVGIDIEPEAAEGARLNLEHFGVLGATVVAGDAADAPRLIGHRVAAVATDPPYGRSATTKKVGARRVLEMTAAGIAEVLEPGGRLAIIVPERDMLAPFERLLKLHKLVAQRVHASLTRNYAIFEKPL